MGFIDRILNRREREDVPQRPEEAPVLAAPVDDSDEWRLRPWTFQDMAFPPLGEWSYAPVRPTAAVGRERAFRMVGAVREHYELGRIVVTGAKAYGGETPDRPNIGIWLGGRVAKG